MYVLHLTSDIWSFLFLSGFNHWIQKTLVCSLKFVVRLMLKSMCVSNCNLAGHVKKTASKTRRVSPYIPRTDSALLKACIYVRRQVRCVCQANDCLNPFLIEHLFCQGGLHFSSLNYEFGHIIVLPALKESSRTTSETQHMVT